MNYLRQSTPVDVELGVFVDSTDGASTEEALALTQADLYLTKNSGTAAQKNDATSATHIWGGNYKIPLDATDTGTLGRLRLMCKKTGALPVKADFMVIPAMIYDAMYAGTDRLDVNVTHIGDTAQTANDNGADINAILIDTGQIGTAGAGLTAVPWNAAWDAEVQSECTDALNTYDPPTKTEMDTGFSGLNNLSAAEVNTQVDAALVTNHLDHLFKTTYDPASKPGAVDALLNEMVENDAGVSRFTENSLEQAPSGTGASAATIADAVWDEAIVAHTANTTFGGKNQKVVPSETVGDYKASGFSTHAASDVWSVVARTLTANTNLNDITAADVKTAIEAAGSHLALIKTQTDDLANGQRLDLIFDELTTQGDTNETAIGNLKDFDPAADTVATVTNLTNAPTNGDLTATMKTSVNAEVDTALNTAIPGLPTADSINQRISALDDLAQSGGSGDLAAILADTNDLQGNQSNWATAAGFSTHSAADVRAEMDSNSTQLAAILTDTGTTLDGKINTIDTVADAIKLKTDNLPTDPADESLLETKIDALNDVSAAEVNAQCDTAISDASLATTASIAALNDFDPAVDAVATVTDVTNQVTADVTAISGSSDAADKLEASAETIVVAAAVAGTLSATAMTTNLTEATDDHYNGRIIIWTSGVLQNQATNITDYDGASRMLTYTAVTEAPSDGDTFVVV